MSEDIKIKEAVVDSRINKVLSLRTDSVTMLESLDAISEFYKENTIDARRSLRHDIELQNINLAKKFLDEFKIVKERLEDLEVQSVLLENACSTLASKVSDADNNMKMFMEKASDLEGKRNSYIIQKKEIESFLSKFQLTNQEVDTLYRAPIDDPTTAKEFFEALKRLRIAYTDCKIMVEQHCYSAGFELLEILGQHQEMAYQRLFEWVKTKCDSLTESGTTEDIDTMLQTAVRYLRKLPIYYSQCQDLIVNSRRTQLVQKFIVALTQGGPASGRGSVGRAIDLHAHDAIRYVGDMLAWMHQAVASEEEFLQAVFGEDEKTKRGKNDISSSSNELDKPSDMEQSGESILQGFSIPELLARSLQGLGRPLRMRIMQTLETRTGLESWYTLTDLLCFYEITFRRLVPMENSVHSAIKGCLNECKRLFMAALNKQAESLTQSPPSYPLDLTVSHVTKECSRQIHEILKVYGAALSPLPFDKDDQCHVDAVLGCIIQPLLQACRLSGQPLQKGDMAIFMLNNVSSIQHELREAAKRSSNVKAAAETWFTLLEQETNTWISVIVSEEAGKTLKRSDLDKLLELVEILPEGLIANEQPGLSQDRIGTVMRAFYASLFSTIAPQFERLQNPELREITRKQTAEAVADAHAVIYKFILSRDCYDKSILAHTIDEVKVLLGIS